MNFAPSSKPFTNTLLSVIFIYLYWLFCINVSSISYISFEVNQKSKQPNFIQLFYHEGGHFSAENAILKESNKIDSFEKQTFTVENKNIHGLRFDPTADTAVVEITYFSLSDGEKKFIFNPDEIKKSFTFNNFQSITKTPEGTLLLRPSAAGDPQLVFNSDIQSLFPKQIASGQVAYALIGLFITLLLLFSIWKGYIHQLIKDILSSTQAAVNRYFEVNNPLFSFLLLLLIAIKYFTISHFARFFITNAVYDDILFLNLAEHISKGEWLGPYNENTLVKGPVYPLFIAFAHFFGISLTFMEFLLLLFGSLLMARALKPLLKTPVIQLGIIAMLLFNPMTTNLHVVRVLRDGFYSSLSIVLFASLIGLMLRIKKPVKEWIIWSVMTGISLFALWNTREEGLIVVPVLLLLGIITLYRFVHHQKLTQSGKAHKTFNRYAYFWLLFPLIIFTSLNGLLAGLNYKYYGAFLRNEFKSTAFTNAYQSLCAIEDENRSDYIYLPKSAMRQAFAVSPTFAQLQGIIDRPDSPWPEYSFSQSTETSAGWLMWVVRDAAKQIGIHKSLPQSQAWYREVSKELNAAFDDGRLKRSKNIPISLYSISTEALLQIPNKLVNNLLTVLRFSHYAPASAVPITDYDLNIFHKFQFMTNEPGQLLALDNQNNTIATRIKNQIINIIKVLFSWIIPLTFGLSIIYMVIVSFNFFSGNIKTKQQWIFLINGCLLITGIIRILLASISDLVLWSPHYPPELAFHYLDQAFPFTILFSLIGTYGLLLLTIKPSKL